MNKDRRSTIGTIEQHCAAARRTGYKKRRTLEVPHNTAHRQVETKITTADLALLPPWRSPQA